MQITDVFTPASKADLSFVERNAVNNELINALSTPGMQIILYGFSGAGKTTLIEKKLEEIYEYHIVTRCLKGMTFTDVLNEAFAELGKTYISEKTVNNKSNLGIKIRGIFKVIGIDVDASKGRDTIQKETNILAPQITPQQLSRVLGETGGCWVIEDFHKIEGDEKTKLAQTMKMFMDASREYQHLKIVAIGAVSTARQVVEYDPEMRERVCELYVPLMNRTELEEIVSKGEKLLNLSFEKVVIRELIRVSSGLASVCHQLCLDMCRAANIIGPQQFKTTISEPHFQKAIEGYINSKSDTLKSTL